MRDIFNTCVLDYVSLFLAKLIYTNIYIYIYIYI